MVKRAVVRFPAGMPRIHGRAFATESSDEQDCDFGPPVRRVEDDGRMRRGIRHPHVLVEEGGLDCGAARSRRDRNFTTL